MAVYDTSNIRNIVLVGHSGSGKTTLAETMLFEAGDISRRGSVQDKNTQSDYTDLEKERGHSLFTSLMHCDWRGNKINILDTPGLDDFSGEVVASTKVADTAILVLNANSGVEVGSELSWEHLQAHSTPTIIVVNHVDGSKADFENTLEQAKSRFGNRVLPLQFPVNQGVGFNAIVDALRMIMYVFPEGGGKPKKEAIPAEHQARAAEMHEALVEAAAENEEALMEKFFEEGTLNEDDLARGLKMGLAHQQFFPVFCVSAEQNMGSGRMMGFIGNICPSPAERPPALLASGGTKPCNPDAKTSLFIYKSVNESRIGLVSYFKVYSGTLKTGSELVNADTGAAERFSQLYISEGKNRESVQELKAGDLGCTVKLKGSHTNQTLNPKGADVKIAPMKFPSASIRMAVESSAADVDKVAHALRMIHEEDPTLRVDQNKELRQTILEGQGQLHLDIVKWKAEHNFGAKLKFAEPRVPYRETITRKAETRYRHKKQSGGSGEFAELSMRIEPWFEGTQPPSDFNVRSVTEDDLPWGGKLVFCWCIVGGAIDSRFINAIKKGLMKKMEEGPLTGSYCRDIQVSIYDGKMHSVDSNDNAFMKAAMYAFRENFHNAGPQLLEPIYDLEVKCDSEVMGNVMGDLQTRRAMIMGMDADGHYQIIKARIPLKELHGYSATLRSLTQGKAKFNVAYADYQAAPGDVQANLLKEYTALAEAAEG